MTKPSRQLHWDSYRESEPVSICASAVSLCLYLSCAFPVTRAPPCVAPLSGASDLGGGLQSFLVWFGLVCVLFICLLCLGSFSGLLLACSMVFFLYVICSIARLTSFVFFTTDFTFGFSLK